MYNDSVFILKNKIIVLSYSQSMEEGEEKINDQVKLKRRAVSQ